MMAAAVPLHLHQCLPLGVVAYSALLTPDLGGIYVYRSCIRLIDGVRGSNAAHSEQMNACRRIPAGITLPPSGIEFHFDGQTLHSQFVAIIPSIFLKICSAIFPVRASDQVQGGEHRQILLHGDLVYGE